jgi:hypothetical protein
MRDVCHGYAQCQNLEARSRSFVISTEGRNLSLFVGVCAPSQQEVTVELGFLTFFVSFVGVNRIIQIKRRIDPH